MRQVVKEMFFHGFDNYMELAFPHDELKPVSGTFVDSLHELGNSNANQSEEYRGIGLTLIDSLSTLAVMNESALFQKLLRWIIENIPNFDLDLRVHVFEVNIRVLGGLLSAHFLASDPDLGLFEGYQGQLIPLMEDLGKRLLKSFGTKSGIPYAWVNLRHGVLPSETTETCTACVGTLLLEFGALSYLTKDFSFFDAAFQSLKVLWSLKNEKTGLLGNTLDLITGRWKNSNAGIGAGIDSFYEYLLKSFIFFGRSDLLNMFEEVFCTFDHSLSLFETNSFSLL